MAINQGFIDELVARADIVDVVSNYVSLKKSGSNYFGLCPFHGEKTPSFSVSADKQIFHCFGCSEGGGAISFIMKIEGLSYVEAIHHIAKMYNLSVLEDTYTKDTGKDKELIYEMNKKTAILFYKNLLDPKNEFIRKYLADRNINKKVATDFGIGYANSSFNELLTHLEKEGYTKDQMLKAGLITKNEKGNMYDRFRGRVMFPIIDVRGNIIAFGGRVIDDSMPKYLNSPETLAFNKSYNLFGINISKKTKKDYFILAEGYMDVIALHKAGFDSAVACLGTSLTEGHAKILLRYTKNVVIAFDADKAGQAAASRAIDILKKVGLNIKVLQMKNAKDPDEYIKKFGKDGFENLINKSENDTQYKFEKIISKYDLENDVDRIECIKELIKMISTLYSSIEREIFITKTSQKTGISKEAITLEFKKFIKDNIKKKQLKERKEVMSPVSTALPKDRQIVYKDIVSAKAEEEIISLLFTDATILGTIEFNENKFSVDLLRKIYSFGVELYKSGRPIDISYFYEILDENEINHLVNIIRRPRDLTNNKEAFRDCIKTIESTIAKRDGDFEAILESKRKARSI